MPRVAKLTPRRPSPASGAGLYSTTTERLPMRMPKALPGGWHPRTRSAWKTLTSAGWTELLIASDAVLLERWCLMTERLHRALDDPEASLAGIKAISAECRALESAIGATPRSRASLHWQGSSGPVSEAKKATVRVLRASDLPDGED